jgi:hypothetical protein
MNNEAFKIGFWHPFGPHGRETAEQILDRFVVLIQIHWNQF